VSGAQAPHARAAKRGWEKLGMTMVWFCGAVIWILRSLWSLASLPYNRKIP